ncbi:MAG: aspartate aminotransferase family protein [Deltaproteobacteria bacterium]|nr:aspartate aminotransferase family protein [Deltaproteobacteria bacterium]
MTTGYTRAILHRRLGFDYPHITHGEGCYLVDEGGKRYLDAAGGAAVACLGHGLSDAAEVVARTVRQFSYLHGSQFTTRELESYAENLIAVAPAGIAHVFFVCSGSEATETAVKLAYQHHQCLGHAGKRKVVYTNPGYHGSTLFAMSVTGKRSSQQKFAGLVTPSPEIPAPVCLRCPFRLTPDACRLECAAALEEAILREGPDTVLAFIVEPVLGASVGVCIPPARYLERVRAICRKHDVSLIFDEIMCGYGRTGKWFASEWWGVTPDIMTAGKGMGAGLVPLSGVFCTAEVLEVIRGRSGDFAHGFTFANNAMAAPVAQFVLDYMKRHALLSRVQEVGGYLMDRLHETLDGDEHVGEIRGLGLIIGCEVVRARQGQVPFERERAAAERIVQEAMKRGVNLYFSTAHADGVRGDAIVIAPPYILTEPEADTIVAVFAESLRAVTSGLE